VSALLERLGVELPIVQAGMGGGLSGHRLAAAVSEAGGLGTIGIAAPGEFREELAAARRSTGRPLAVNLLLPFARREHWRIAADADAVVTFWGRPKRRTDGIWIHQCGSVGEASAARAAGADAVIAQGVEAGGHVRGELPALDLLASVRAELPADYPVLSAGGVINAASTNERLEAGAAAVVSGTRFLLSDESEAHPEYKRRLLEATDTRLTRLFGFGWPAPHRVVANAATERWLDSDGRAPGWLSAVQRITAPALGHVPDWLQTRLAAGQRPGLPLLGPIAPVAGGPEALVDAGALYAGECVRSIDTVRPAGELVRELADE
jgi:nitronate monooxygenase